jgi:hypothetical protein
VETLALNTVFLDDDARASDDFARVALTVDLAETSPGTENLGISNLTLSSVHITMRNVMNTNLDEVDLVLSAKSLNQLDVLSLSASLDKNAKMGMASVKSLGALAKATGEAIVNEGIFEHLLQGVLYGHLALGGGGDFDLLNSVNLNFISSVRHPKPFLSLKSSNFETILLFSLF